MSLRKLLAAIMVVSMVLGLVGTSALAAESEQWDSATVLLQQFGIVTGDASGDLRLNDNITRAEMVKVLVAAAGAEELANLLKGAPSFTDVAADAWYSGYVAFAKNAGITGGYADGTFQPEAQVTYAEVVAFLAKFLGIEPVAGAEWPNNYIQAFENAGLAAEGLNLAEFANAPAVRGWVFTLADNAFRYGGAESVYAYLDGEAPELTVDAVAGTTEATKVTVSGKVSGAEALFVNDAAVEVGADGSFSAEVALAVGANSILVKAVDEVGLEAVKTVEVTRTLAPAASIEAEAITVEAGQTVDVAVKVLDQNGEVIADAEVSGESEVGTFAAGKFTAGEKAGTGTLTLKYGELSKSVAVTVKAGALAKLEVTPSASAAAPGEMVTFTVKGFDALGNEVSGIAPTFSFEGSDALINPSTGNFIASKAGTYTVTATVGEVKGSAAVAVYADEVAELAIEGPATLLGNDDTTAEFTVKAVDENGNLVGNSDLVVDIAANGGTLQDADGATITKVTLENGVAKFYLVASDAEWGQIVKVTAQDEDDELDEVSAEIEILEQVASAVNLYSADKYLAANEAGEVASVTFEVVDQDGVRMLDGAWDIEWTVSGPAEIGGDTEGTVTTIGGAATLTLESLKGETGTITVTANIEGIGSATANVTAAVAGDPAKMVVELSKDSYEVTDDATATAGVKVTVTVTDSRGVPVKYNNDVKVDFGADLTDFYADAGVTAADGDDSDATADDAVLLDFDGSVSKRSFRFVMDAADEYELTVKDTAASDALSKVTAKVTFTAGAPETVAFDWSDFTNGAKVAATSPKGQVTLQLRDEFDNDAAKAGVKVKVKAVKGTDTSAAATEEVTLNGESGVVTVETDAEGKAVIEYETRPYTNQQYTLAIVDADSDVDGEASENSLKVTVVPAIPASVSLRITNSAGSDINSIAASGEVKFEATVKDQFGAKLAGFEDYVTFEVGDEEWGTADDGTLVADEDIEGLTLEASSGVYTLGNAEAIYAGKAERLSVKVKLNVNGSELVATDSVRVTPGDDYQVVVAEAEDGEIALDEGKVKAVTLKVADKWGNVKSGEETYYVTFSFDPSKLAVRKASDGTNLTEMTGTDVQTGSVVSLRTSTTIYLIGTADDTLKIYLVDNQGTTDSGQRNDDVQVGQESTYTIDVE